MFHYRKNRKKYGSFPKPKSCDFCVLHKTNKKISETKYSYIIENRIYYDLWEMRKVTDHLLVIPKRHVRSLSELSPEERLDIIDVLAEYEGKNYNVYARSINSKQRSVAGHQHTHLIKTEDAQAHGQIVLRKPYFMIKF